MIPQCNVAGRRRFTKMRIQYSVGSFDPTSFHFSFLCRVEGRQRGSGLPPSDPVKKENLSRTCCCGFSLAFCRFWQFSCDVSGNSQLGVQACLCAAGLAARCIPQLGDAGQIQVPGTRGEGIRRSAISQLVFFFLLKASQFINVSRLALDFIINSVAVTHDYHSTELARARTEDASFEHRKQKVGGGRRSGVGCRGPARSRVARLQRI